MLDLVLFLTTLSPVSPPWSPGLPIEGRGRHSAQAVVYAVEQPTTFTRDTIEYRADPIMLADIYRPTGVAAIGVVVLVHGTAPATQTDGPKDWPFFRSYAAILAQSGFVVVVPNHRLGLRRPQPQAAEDDLRRLIEYVARTRPTPPPGAGGVSVMLFSGAGVLAAPLLSGRLDGLRSLVMMYPTLDPTILADYAATPDVRERYVATRSLAGPTPKRMPVFVGRAGEDAQPGVNVSIDVFIAHALEANIDLQLLNVAQAGHGLEASASPADVAVVVDAVIAFLKATASAERRR